MFNIEFNINPKVLKQIAMQDLQKMIAIAKNRKNKTFQISVGERSYNIRYVIGTDNYVNLFVALTNASERSMVVPTLRLNIGDILLPESMSVSKSIYDDIPVPVPYKTVGYTELPDEELKEIYQEIQKQGFFNLLKTTQV